jgi:uncharacterized protein (DUF433 family)
MPERCWMSYHELWDEKVCTWRVGKMPKTTTAHIHLDDWGRAWIDDTNTKVIEVVLDQIAYGWSPEEIHFQHSHLSMSQIHAALSYYYDHQAEFDAEIERQLQEYDELRAQVEDSPIRKRLRALGKLP